VTFAPETDVNFKKPEVDFLGVFLVLLAGFFLGRFFIANLVSYRGLFSFKDKPRLKIMKQSLHVLKCLKIGSKLLPVFFQLYVVR
jgi:hypothetical protein